jgi:thiopeptide-type bacteriocin biosynthesis protein
VYEPIPTFLLRAPLLPERQWRRGRAALAASRWGADAVALASGRLATADDSPARRRALDRYARRAALRTTPAGLLAGVCVGALGSATQIASGVPVAWLAPTWQRLAALGRALLDDAATRSRARLRAAPSLVRAASTIRWLAFGDDAAEERVADLDERLAAILDATAGWTSWARARRATRTSDALEADELLLLLVDDGLLKTDLAPPLVGPAAADWMRARLERLGRGALARDLTRATTLLARGELARGAAALAALPGAGGADDQAVQGVLVHRPRRPPTLSRAAVARAAALAPLLFRLQDALAPPAAERLAQPALDEALDAITEIHGAGALELGAVAANEYGVSAGADDEDQPDEASARRDPTASPAVLVPLVDAIVAAARAGRAEARLDVAALSAALDGVGPAPPPTCELFLAPTPARGRARKGSEEGAGWLLGLHAPAGASWGRFAAALGAPLARALDAVAAAERDARPAQEPLDVSFAPSAALADLCAHPRTRRRALAISEWPDDDAGDLTLLDLELVADPAAATPLALRDRRDGAPVVPSPLARVRSTTAPPGVSRLLCGWSLFRQHAPWALALGPLAALAHVPRLVLDGFVVSPASWRVDLAHRASAASVRRWRRATRIPRFVHVGHEDQLLVVDLDAATSAADLGGHARVWEIWPPLGAPVDRDGRRVEAVVALVDRPDADEADADVTIARAIRAAGRVPPPRALPPPPDWLTFKVFGAPEHQDALLRDAIRPAVASALREREIDSWFFQRYVDGPGRRHHLRVRVRAATARARAAFTERLAATLGPARATGSVTTVESGDFHPERARFGGALAATLAIFQSDSELACALLDEAPSDETDAANASEPIVRVVRAFDALARGLGLDLVERQALARARRRAEEAHAPLDDDARADTDAELRARGRALRAALDETSSVDSSAARALAAHVARTARATEAFPREARAALAPALLHLACVRLAGPDRDLERRAYTFWERTLEGLRACARQPR